MTFLTRIISSVRIILLPALQIEMTADMRHKVASFNFRKNLQNFFSLNPLLTFLIIYLQVYKNEHEYYYIDVFDVNKSNWMRYVSPAYDVSQQNLVACQVKGELYFYTFKPILPNQELQVWYCKEYANRLQATIEIENGIRKYI